MAVLLVLIFHLWPDAVPGGYVGVDVFFVISGFLITSHLLEHPPRSARDLAGFWGRRIRRLLPAAFLVLATTLVATRLVAPETQWAGVAQGVVASALYVQNWALAANAVDYLAAANAPTATQHYWSLSVEEQFYLFWPVLVLAVAWVARRAGVSTMGAARLAMAVVVGLSLAISISATASEPASAYFITPTRVWELAAGGLIATLPPLSALGLAPRLVDGTAWFGLGLTVGSALVLSAATPFPGIAAALPVLGAALLLVCATQRAESPTGVLRLRPIQHIGDTSYSIYLWHWPLIVLAPYVLGSVSLVVAIGIISVTFALATVTKRFVEDPVRFAPALQPLRPTFRFAAVGMAVVVAIGGIQLLETQLRTNAAVAQVRDVAAEAGSCFGAAAIVRGFDVCPQEPDAPMVPEPLAALADKPDAYGQRCMVDFPFTQRLTCTYGDGPIQVALVGNSHATQWLPTLQVIAAERGWTITTFLTFQCNVTEAALHFDTPEKVANCSEYGRWAMDQTSTGAFDLIVTSQRQSVATVGATARTTMEPAIEGYLPELARWHDAGARVVVLRDTPYPYSTVRSVPDCLAQHPDDRARCGGTPASWLPIDPLYEAARQAGLPGVVTLDTTGWLCTSTRCPAVIGNVVVYLDASHLTATYARTLAPYLSRALDTALGDAR